MKISASALLLALGASDAFTGPSPSKPSLTVLQAVRQLSGGIGGSNLMDDRSPPDINAPWGRHTAHDAPQYSAPTQRAFNSDYNGGEPGSYLMNGGTGGSSLLADRGIVDRDAPWGNKFPYEATGHASNGHAFNGMTGGIGGSSLMTDGPIEKGSVNSPGYYRNYAPNHFERAVYEQPALPAQNASLQPPPSQEQMESSKPLPEPIQAEPVQAAVPPPPPAGPAPWSKAGNPNPASPTNPSVQGATGNRNPSFPAVPGPQVETTK